VIAGGKTRGDCGPRENGRYPYLIRFLWPTISRKTTGESQQSDMMTMRSRQSRTRDAHPPRKVTIPVATTNSVVLLPALAFTSALSAISARTLDELHYVLVALLRRC
jgi:hypothetical protein